MKKTNLLITVAFLFFLQVAGAQTGYMDNALHYNNRLLREKSGDGVYKMVGHYKVTGTSYLFGEKNKGDMFSPEAKAYNIFLSYNTYTQELEFYSSANPDKPLIKTPGTVDSFMISANSAIGIESPLKFIYGSHLGTDEKAFFLELFSGPKYGIYKRYKSDLGYVTANYSQPDLRQFDLLYDYFYVDVEKKKMKKLKTAASAVIREFKDVKDLSPVFSAPDFTSNEEIALKKAFQYLND